MKKGILLALSCAIGTFAMAQEKYSFEKAIRLKADNKILDVQEVGHSAPIIYDYNKDGKEDLLVGFFGTQKIPGDTIRTGHALTQGGTKIYLNKGTNATPEYTYTGTIKAGGEMIYVPSDCCNGMTPRFADLNGDGIDDIVSGSYPGQAYYWEGLGEGMFAKGGYLLDKDGKALNPGHSNSCIPFDWDNDGDFDLVWGIRIGEHHIYYSINEGTKSNPQFTQPKPIEIKPADGNRILVTNAVPADWNGDELFDLVCGSEFGQIVWLKNKGTKGNPKFDTYEILINKELQYGLATQVKEQGSRLKLEVFDYNKDGKLDILAGDVNTIADTVYNETPEERKIHAEKSKMCRAEVAELQKNPAYLEVRTKAEEIVKESPNITLHEAMAMAPFRVSLETRKAYSEMQQKKADLYNNLYKGKKKSKLTNSGFVWMFLRK
jgi:hypothetical protein